MSTETPNNNTGDTTRTQPPNEPPKPEKPAILDVASQKEQLRKQVEERQKALKAVQKNGVALEALSSQFKKDKEIVLAAVKQNGWALKFADKSLKKDKEVVLTAVKQNWWALNFVDKSLEKDKEFILAALKQNWWALNFADKSLEKDKEFILAAVKQNWRALDFADKSLKKDKEVVLTAVKQNWRALDFADKSLKKDKEVVLTAVKQHGWALKFADESLKNNKEFILTAVKQDWRALRYADELLNKNREVILAAVKQNEWALNFADESLKKDKEVVLTAVKADWRALRFADESLKNNKEFILTAVKQSGWGLLAVNNFLQNNIERLRSFLDDPPGFNKLEKLIQDLKELDIEFPERLDSQIINQIIISRKNLDKKENLPLAVVIYPKEDWNEGFKNNQIKDLISRGYRVVYFEAGNEDDVYSSLKAATVEVDKKADLFILGGHGNQTSISMGAGDPAKSKIANEEFYIDTSDEKEMMSLTSCLNKNSVVILESCSTGKGKSEASNVANTLKSVFPQSKIFAPTISARVEKYEYDSNNKVIRPIYDTSAENTYSTQSGEL